MIRKVKSLVDVAGSLRRAHAALADAIVMLRKVSLRGEEAGENQHRLRLAEAQVFEVRYHLSAARSLLAVGVHVDEVAAVPGPLRTLAQVSAARGTIRRLERLRGEVERELRALATRVGEPSLARLDDLPAERLPLPLAEGMVLGGVVVVLVGIGGLLAGGTAFGLAAIGLGALSGFAGADALRR